MNANHIFVEVAHVKNNPLAQMVHLVLFQLIGNL